ncbi:uveal autoantigen with coiled-coil domains and ankyrin repeats isoform X1 [Silurus asotus]|uniref:Uveal autoantigen with coiled-coil domains and ankyrin repeats isoform X1 n=1 Tax=Silurus asotus TaxID=30991 RepID=A0AAD5AYR4_SILAS|nr:uveal autoantigen with coiled-coil domains and ankyrin repeats isoform X1 [Silurus asotus]
MKSLKQRLKKHEASSSTTNWNKYDERLIKAVESDDVDKVTSALKKGAVATKLDADGRSSLHLAACNGLINSLNVFLTHGVNLRTADAAGKTALHLSSRGGYSACVQRLLQCKSPVDSTDLQGRTSLHEASYGGHTTIIKMLCGSGAAVSAVDKDGRSPLMIAALMGHSRACQQLLNCGASVNLQDKQNKTALLLACEHICREVVEVLLKYKADVTAVDMHGHDSCHYARLSGDQALITMINQAWEAASKGKSSKASSNLTLGKKSCICQHLATIDIVLIQHILLSLKHGRSMNSETHMLLRKMSVQAPAKGPSSGLSCPATVPTQQHTKEYASHSENGNLQSYHVDCAQVRHHAPHSAAPASFKAKEVPMGEADLLKRELWDMRRRHDAAQEELLRLDSALVMRTRDYEELRRSSERALQQAHNHAWELEAALGEVQRRMVGSEAKVRQMQAHLVAVRENLVEELRVQLLEARAELHRARSELGQSKREAEEQKERNDMLQQEVHKLTEELLKKENTDNLKASLSGRESETNEIACKEIQTPLEWKPGPSKTTMTYVTGETLQQEIDKKSYINLEEHESIRSSLSNALQRAQSQANEALMMQQKTSEENQSLIRELQEQRTELDTLQEALEARFVPVAMLEAKENEVAQLRLALKQMEESKEREEDGKKASSAESQEQSQPEATSQNNKCTQTEETPEKCTNTAKGQNEDSDIIVEAEGQRAAQNCSSAPNSVCSLAHSDNTILKAHINSLEQQLENSERHYRQVLDIYRTRLLNAAQGHMDDEAKTALLQIAQMRQECVC